MRLIGGEFRGRKLKAPKGLRTRPTADRVREALFSILASRVQGALFLDGYAGTGAVGLEALSRGARRCVFVERDRAAARVLAENVASLGAGGRSRILTCTFTRAVRSLAGEEGDFEIIFLDPPYDTAEILRALRLVATGTLLSAAGLLVAQHDSRLDLPTREHGLVLRRTSRYGASCLSFYTPGGCGGSGIIDTSAPPL